MLISFNWLKQYVNLPDSTTPEEVADKLKLSTVEVEGLTKQGSDLANIVVGKIIACEKHPNADKLKVCQVDVNENVTIVCGGSNVAAGMLVAVALNGAKVKWHGEGQPIELKTTTIRGVESNGMICASDEIGLATMFPKKEEKEIIDLTSLSAKPGTPLAAALGQTDTIFEIDNKSLSNRPDLWGHYGLAREAAALFNRSVSPRSVTKVKEAKELRLKVTVEDTVACPKFVAVAMNGIVVAPSPAWLQERLRSVGLNPINNIVDVTNYVMLDSGKPMHAFDAAHIADSKLFVREAKEGEKIILLDGHERILAPGMVVVASKEKTLALAGIMGGQESAISNSTASIIFESAIWDAALIRKTTAKLGLRTDASARFEKSLDPALCEESIGQAIELVLQLCPGAKVTSSVESVGKPRLFTGPLEIPWDFFAKKLGIEIPAKSITTILERLGFTLKLKKKYLSVKIPSWRATKDISIPEDIVEEVARIYGYDAIPASLPNFPVNPAILAPLRSLERHVAEVMARDLGYTESYNYSFVSEAQIKRWGDDPAKYLVLDNPISKEKPYIRRNLLLNLLENVEANLSGVEHLRLFEIGKVFHSDEAGVRAESKGDELLPRQDTWLTSMYVDKKNHTPFFGARLVAEKLAHGLGVSFSYAPAEATPLHPWQHPGRTAWLQIGAVTVGCIYELHPQVAEVGGLSDRVGICSLNVSLLADLLGKEKKSSFTAIALYPEITRDIAFLVKQEVTYAEVVALLGTVSPLLKKIELFDVFTGKGIPAGHKSMGFHLVYESAERTLTAAEVDIAQERVEKMLKEKCNAEIRK